MYGLFFTNNLYIKVCVDRVEGERAQRVQPRGHAERRRVILEGGQLGADAGRQFNRKNVSLILALKTA